MKKENELLEKLTYESARVEDIVYAFARKNGLTGFIDKWGSKPYNDADHTLHHMVGELLDQLIVDNSKSKV